MSFKINLKCQIHKNKDIQFIQVNGILDQLESKQIFYCALCVSDDDDFQQSDFMAIDELLEKGETEIIKQWPPLNKKSILQNLKAQSCDQNYFNYTKKVKEYFLQLKNEISNRLDAIQQEVIDKINVYPDERQTIIEQYQNISEIYNFKQIFKNFNQQDFSQKQLQCRKFIEKMEKNKEKNSNILEGLSSKISILKRNIDFQLPNTCKEQIQFLINQINFFKEPTDQSGFFLRQRYEAQIDPAQKIMDLVSNKSNFCSQNFLNQFEKDLRKFSHLFNKSIYQDTHSQYKINFNLINEQELNQIKQYINHKNRINHEGIGSKYVAGIFKKKPFYQIMNTINNSNLDQEEIKEFKQILAETEPFYNQYNSNPQGNLKNVIESSAIQKFFSNFNNNETLASLYAINLSRLSLFDFSPEKIQLKDIFEQAKQIIQENEYLNLEIVDNMNNIPESIQNCFNNADSEQTIARKIMNLYSLDSIKFPVYKFLNSTLFLLNNELIQILEPFYLIFGISLFIYSDQDVTQIMTIKPLSLYRGINIKNQDFNEIIQQNNIISLPGFSSFSTEKRTAELFTKISKFSDTTPVIFKCSYQISSRNYAKRPKNISKVAQFNENEYIFYPFTQFKIISYQQKDDYYLVKISYIKDIQH
ncbi:hypothetical protein ABPG72_006449 [Tetrahymena utriculariae]